MRQQADDVHEVVRDLLRSSPTLFLGTTATDEPWCSGAFFLDTDLFALSILLEPHGRTCTNLRTNPRAAMILSSGNPFEPFLQGSGDATIVEDESDVRAVADAMLEKAPQVEPFLGGPMVAVRVHVSCWRATDVNRGWIPARELSRHG